MIIRSLELPLTKAPEMRYTKVWKLSRFGVTQNTALLFLTVLGRTGRTVLCITNFTPLNTFRASAEQFFFAKPCISLQSTRSIFQVVQFQPRKRDEKKNPKPIFTIFNGFTKFKIAEKLSKTQAQSQVYIFMDGMLQSRILKYSHYVWRNSFSAATRS